MKPILGKKSSRDLPPDLSAAGVGATMNATRLANAGDAPISLEELKELIGVMPGKSMGEFKDISTIGIGGMGAIFSAHEPILNREIAVKILRPAYQNHLGAIGNFIREARITAQIDHPNVIPVHRLGVFDDAGVYFTMKRVEGVTLAYVLRELQAGNSELLRLYTRRRLLAIFVAVCNGVAFAHSKGIIHRDLKPLNVMIGDYGEVFVMDWGLAVYRAEHDRSFAARKIEIGNLPDEEKSGKLNGTPAFMAPELATGGEADERSDVYALGAILYSILTWEQAPLEAGLPVDEVLHKVVTGQIQRPRRRAPRRRVPYELEAITLKAMALDRNRRYESVEALIADVRNYLDKFPVSAYSPLPWYRLYKFVRRRPLVPIVLTAAILTLAAWNGYGVLHDYAQSRSLLESAEEQMGRADIIRNQALSAYRNLNDFYRYSGSTEATGSAIVIRANSFRLRDEYEVLSTGAWEKLRKALDLNAGRARAMPVLAKLFEEQFQFAFATSDQQLVERLGNRLRGLPNAVQKKLTAIRPSLAQYLKAIRENSGELVIRQPLPGITLTAVPDGRRSREDPQTFLLHTMPEKNLLPTGSYAILATQHEEGKPEAEVMRFPVVIERGTTEELVVEIPAVRLPEKIYVPGGNFIFGNRMADNHAAHARLDGYFIDRHEVTFGEYLEFWKSLTDAGEKSRFTAYGEWHTPERRIVPLWDDAGKLNAELTASMPVSGITPEAAEAYCRWKSEKTGLRYRLPTLLEWEKAARGVDGREYVWGSEWKSGIANTAQEGKPGMAVPVETFPGDCSVYGVYDMAGNVRELVTGPDRETPYVVKGGGFASPARFTRLAENAYETTLPDLGFRCVVEIPANDGASTP